MSLKFSPTTYRTVSLTSDQEMLSPSVQYITTEVAGTPTYKTLNLSSVPTSHLQYASNGATVDGNMVYETVRYLVPVERRAVQDSYVIVNSAPQVLSSPVVSPMYVQKVPGYNVNTVNSVDESDFSQSTQIEVTSEKAGSVFSQSPTSVKSPVSFSREVDITLEDSSSSRVQAENVVELKQVFTEVEPEEKLDTRFFGELLAEVYRKNYDIHACVSEHVGKIRGRKHILDATIDYKVDKEELESLIPKGMSELTKQQMRYLLQTRAFSDKTLRLLLTTFSSLKDELLHLQEDLRRLESEKEELEKNLSFKADQAVQYDRMLEAVRENNRQLQVSVKESAMTQRSLETQMLTSRSSESSRDYRVKEMEGRMKALEQENSMLRQKLAGQDSSSGFQTKTEELSKQYNQMLSSMSEEKEKEIQSLRSQLLTVKTEYSTQTTSDKSLELRIKELVAMLEQRESTVRRQEQEIKRLQQDKVERSRNITQTVITKKYSNQYPMLGLLNDDYQVTSPVKEAKTIVIESTTKM